MDSVKIATLKLISDLLDETSLGDRDSFVETYGSAIHVTCEGDYYFRIKLEPIDDEECDIAAIITEESVQ